MADNKRDLSEELFVAIETIANKSLEGLKYDRTILCTITDASNADASEYTVSDGSVDFLAYSNNGQKYSEGTNVYVTIPQGDYNSEKYIIGKYIKEDDDKPYNYISPTENYVEIINLNNEMSQINPVTNKKQNAGSILANKENRKIVKIFEKTNITNLDGYDMLGIKADFRTILSDFNTIEGNYGLMIKLVCKESYDTDYVRDLEADRDGPNSQYSPIKLQDKNNKTLQTVEKDSVLNTYLLYFDSDEMFGNPYNFVTNMSQEQVFNISEYKGIESLTLYLYQQNNFKDINNQNIPYQFESVLGNEDLPDNIFVDNIEISFGYSLSKFEDNNNSLLLYSLDSKNYSTYITNNTKTIQFKWLRKINDIIRMAANSTEVENNFNLTTDKYKIIWYRWNLNPDTIDELGGTFWEKCAENVFNYSFVPNLMSQYERFKVGVAIYGDKIESEENTESDIIPIEEYYESEIVEFFNEEDVPSSTTLDLIYGLTLTTKDNLGGVYIIYLPNGSLMNDSQKDTQRYIIASYSSLFTGVTGLDGTETITWKVPAHNTMIEIDTGINPETNSLYEVGGKTWEKKDGYWVIENAAISTKEEVEAALGESVSEEENEIAIGSSNGRKSILPFKIAKTYSPQLTNNTVECIIHKNGLHYRAFLPMSFGVSGTNGTDYTLVFEIADPNANALFTYASGESDRPYWLKNGKYVEASDNEVETTEDKSLFCYYRHTLQVRAQLRDYNGQVLKPDGGMTFGWYFKGSVPNTDPTPRAVIGYGYLNSQFNSEDNFYYQQVVGKIAYNENYSCGQGKFTEKNKPNPNEYVPIELYPRIIIAKVTARYNGQNLEAYLPIPIVRLKSQCKYIFEGPTTIYYDANGQTPTYTRIPYKLWNGDSQILTDNSRLLSWELGIYQKNNCKTHITTNGSKRARDKDNKGDGYPYLDNDSNSLICPQIYFNNLYTDKMPCICVYGHDEKSNSQRLLWIQPILVLLNRFGSSMLNKWDGSLTIDEENNQILTSVIAAGKKENDNSYSGVVLGEIAKASNVKDKTGLLGYHGGKQTFLLSADDGHLELGESGAGQIIMQGSSGEIKSGNYSSTDGMKIDLKDGQITAYNFKLSSNKVTIDSTGGDSSTKSYFKVTGNDTSIPLIDVQEKFTLLQSKDKCFSMYLYGTDSNTSFLRGRRNLTYWSTTENKLLSTTFPAVFLSNSAPFLQITGLNYSGTTKINNTTYIINPQSTTLLYLGNRTQFMKSANYEEDKSGMNINLNDGQIDAYNFKLTSQNVSIDSSGGNSYFKVLGANTNNPLIDATSTQTLLQSSDTSVQLKLSGNDETSFFKLNKKVAYWSSTSSTTKIYPFPAVYISNTNPYFAIRKFDDYNRDTTKVDGVTYPIGADYTPLLYISDTSQYLRSGNYSTTYHTGMNINLSSGQITGYNSKLTFYKPTKTYYLAKKINDNNYEISNNPPIETSGTKKSIVFEESIDGYAAGTSHNVYVALTVEDNLSFKATKANKFKEWAWYCVEEETIDSLSLNSDTYADFPISVNNGNFKVSWAGTLIANAGRIGGWHIYPNYLSSNAGTVGMAKWLGNDKPVFWSGYDAYDNADWAYKVGFGVAGDGTLYANKAHIGSWTIDFNSTTYPKALIGGPFKKVTKINDGGEPVKTEIEQDKRVILDPESGIIRANQFVGYLNGVAYSAKYVENVPSHTHDVTVPEHTHDITLYYTKKSNVQVVTDVVVTGRIPTPVYDYLTYISDISTSSGTKLANFQTESSSSDSGSTGSSGDNCFLMGTKILMADYSYKNIENIQIGDIILAYDEDKKIFIPDIVIKNQLHTGVKQLRKIIFNNDNNNNDSIILTPGHPILTLDGWKSQNIDISLKIHNVKAKYLTVKDQIIDYMLNNNQILSIIEINNNQLPVYNITTKYTHTYIANNIITHNKMVVYPVEQ